MLALKGWQAFKRHAHLFPHPNFILSETVFESGNDCKILHVYMINKKTLVKCLTEFEALFQTILTEDFSPGVFIAKLEAGYSLPMLVNRDEMLLGIILGYGPESAFSFKNMQSQCSKTSVPIPTTTYCRIDLQSPKGCNIDPVVFMGNPNSQEVRHLTTIYEQELEQFWQHYHYASNPLQLVLEQLCAY